MTGSLPGCRILVVEDEYLIAADIRKALAGEDAEVVGPVGRLDRGLELVEAAVLDVNLRGGSSLAVVDELRSLGVPFLLVTGYDGWSLPAAYRNAPRLSKPFAMPQVIDAVRGLVGRG